METLHIVNSVIGFLFLLCFSYQLLYTVVALVTKKKETPNAKKQHKYAVLIAARNEEAVIAQLLESLQKQDYPPDLRDIYVVADNCTDQTAKLAREAGAHVVERYNTTEIGKGYALNFLLHHIRDLYGYAAYDGYFVFDADNLLEENYITEMNKVFDQGHEVVTGYRNSKNYGSNWISAGYALCFLRECKFLNNSRMILRTSSVVSGTGFLVHHSIFEQNDGWKHHLLTEDTEFTVDCILHGKTVAYCGAAALYDEQPTLFRQSWQQRLRWTRGYIQVFRDYGRAVLRKIFKEGSFACIDMLFAYLPAIVLTFLSFLVNLGMVAASWFSKEISAYDVLVPLLNATFNTYGMLFVIGLLTTITEWRKIRCRNYQKIAYLFTFPLFMLTYLPVSIVGLLKQDIGWSPIRHTVSKSLEEMHSS